MKYHHFCALAPFPIANADSAAFQARDTGKKEIREREREREREKERERKRERERERERQTEREKAPVSARALLRSLATERGR